MTCCVMPAVAVMLPGLMPHDCFSPTGRGLKERCSVCVCACGDLCCRGYSLEGSPTDSEDSDHIQIASSCQSTTAACSHGDNLCWHLKLEPLMLGFAQMLRQSASGGWTGALLLEPLRLSQAFPAACRASQRAWHVPCDAM